MRGNATSPMTATTTVIKATVGTAIATGTFELETLTKYSKLREHVTITTTRSATSTTSGSVGVETVLAVVLPLGAAWFLTGTRRSISAC